MGRDRKVEKELIEIIAASVRDYDFIIYTLNHMDTVEKKKELLEWLKDNPTFVKKDIEWKMFSITTGIEV